MSHDNERYINTSVSDAKSSLECLLTQDPGQAAEVALWLLKELYQCWDHISRRKMAAAILRKAATRLTEDC